MLLSSCRLTSSHTRLVGVRSKLHLSAAAARRRTFSSSADSAKTTADAVAPATNTKSGWWHSVQLWGGLGALAGWGMSGAAIYDAMNSGPEVISLTMTPVLIVYSTMFARWAWIVQPRNLLLCGCHITNVMAQLNQVKRALEYKLNNGQEKEAKRIMQQAAMGGAFLVGSVGAGPTIQRMLTSRDLGVVSRFAAAPAGPFTGTSVD
jgi:hypothetical protein